MIFQQTSCPHKDGGGPSFSIGIVKPKKRVVIKEKSLNDADYLTRIQKRSSGGVEPKQFYEEEPGIESPFLNVQNMHRSIDF